MNRILICFVLAIFLTACAKPQPSPTVDEVVEQALPETTEIAEAFTEVPSWSDIIAQGTVKDRVKISLKLNLLQQNNSFETR